MAFITARHLVSRTILSRASTDAVPNSCLHAPAARFSTARSASVEQGFASLGRPGDETVPLTHEQLATLLGVGRSYTSRVMQTFKAEGVLETRRGPIRVRNPEALKIRACLCNDSVKNHFEEVLRGVYPTIEAHSG